MAGGGDGGMEMSIATAACWVCVIVSVCCWLFYAWKWPRVGWENLYVQTFEIITWFIAVRA